MSTKEGTLEEMQTNLEPPNRRTVVSADTSTVVQADDIHRQKPQRRQHRILSLVLLTPSLPILSILWLIWERSLDVPHQDEWVTVRIVYLFNHGTLRWADLWAFHNEHRIVIPRIINLIVIELTNWNRQIEMTVNLAIAIGTALLLLQSVRQTASTPRVMYALVAPLSLLLLSPAQFDNWLSPFQVTFIVTVFGIALCTRAMVIQPASRRGFSIAIIGALIASLSSVGGLSVWIVFLPALWSAGYRKVQYAILWIGTTLAVIIPYFVGFPHEQNDIKSPLLILRYALAYLGASIGSVSLLTEPHIFRSQVFAVIGTFLMVINLIAYWRLGGTAKAVMPWISLALFSLASTGITALGRGPQFGIVQALTPRYQIFSSLWWISLIVIAIFTIDQLHKMIRIRWKWRSFNARWAIICANVFVLPILCINLLALSVTLISFIQTDLRGFGDGRIWLNKVRADKECVINYELASDECLDEFYFSGGSKTVREDSAYLDQEHLSVFRSTTSHHLADLKPLPQTTLSFIDTVGPVTISIPHQEPVIIQRGEATTVTGWAVDGPSKSPAGTVVVSVDDMLFLTTYGSSRPDVAHVFSNPVYQNSGFQAVIPANQLSLGAHTVTIRVVTKDMTAYYESAQRVTITVI